MSKQAAIIVISLLWLGSLAASEKAQTSIRLQIIPHIMAPTLAKRPEGLPANAFVMMPVADLLIENCGSESVKIPTRNYPFEQPTEGVLLEGPEHSEITFRYRYASLVRGDKKIQVSECAFNPVVLQPGEFALLAMWQTDRTYVNVLPDEFRHAKFVYQVQSDLAAKFGWWSGEVSVGCDFTKLPDYPHIK